MLNLSDNAPKATIDFETRSECSIRDCGSWKYSLHPTTEVLCLAFRLPYWAEGRTGLWHPAFPHLDIEENQFGTSWDDLSELFEWVIAGELLEAHNAFFELGIWKNILECQGWPRVGHSQWRCSAAKAAAHSLPRGLEDAVLAMNLGVNKDTEGEKVMKKMAQPRKAIKADIKAWGVKHGVCGICNGKGKVKIGRAKATACEACAGVGWSGPIPTLPTLWHEGVDLLTQLFTYCRTDVLAEEALSAALPDLNPQETQLFLLDLRINERGFQLDEEGIHAALAVVDEECVTLNAELTTLTDGVVTKATQRARMLDWLESEGVNLPNTQGDIIDGYLEAARIPERPKRALELMRTLGRSSTAKFETMLDWVCPDHRVHGGLLYHGASTGRWTGKGIQPHNFPRGGIKDMEGAWEAIKTLDRGVIAAFPKDKAGTPYGDVMEMLSHALRGAIVPTPGKQLFVADYAAIEARVVMWLAGDNAALDIFRRGEDIYCFMASDIYGYPTHKDTHPEERQVGKAAILGLGYQMGWSKFMDTAAKGGVTLDEDFAQQVVTTYREKFWRVKQLWSDMEEAAMDATINEDCYVESGKVKWYTNHGFLYCELPSGRCLAYPEPEVRERRMPWGDYKDTLSYMGINAYNHQWERQTTYGGMLVENITQAVARDIMAEAMVRCEDAGYPPVLSVHDELICEAEEGSVKEFEQLVAETPDWAEGCPIAAEGWTGLRYRK